MAVGKAQGQGNVKKPLTEAQKAALAKGQAKRRANLAGRRANHGRQAASSQVASLPALARDAISQPANPQEANQASDDRSPSASGPSSSTKSKLSQDEQDALMFSFVMDEDNDKDAAAATSEPKKSSVGDKLASLLTSDTPKPTGNQQEDDAQQAAAQWQDLAAIAFIFIAGQIFGADLAPSEKQAQAMAAPLCRILMRHVAPLRNASADAYDIAAFAGATLIYYQSISPELARRRAERKVLSASTQTKPAATQAAANGQPGGSGQDTAQQSQRGNVRILYAEDTPSRRRYDEQPPQDRGAVVRENEQQSHRRDAGAAIISETLGVEI